ncbi:TPA: hypothetical protein EYP66_06375 [Candidatus Poribacteria bacterium]|nr:hypothetical protein [Candidatus Poribacteria bacterium]
MSPALNAWLGLIFVVAGAVSVFTMLEIRGRPKLNFSSKTLIMIHRISGYIFVLIYLALVVFMAIKLSKYQVELSPRANIHILLAVAMLPILAIKLLIARIYKKLSGELLFLGVTLFTLGFSLNVTTGGYYLMRNFSGIYVSPTGARSLTDTKCSRCHTLERAYSGVRTKEGWESIVKRMRGFDEEWILGSDVPEIVDYLVRIRGVK